MIGVGRLRIWGGGGGGVERGPRLGYWGVTGCMTSCAASDGGG